MKHGTLIGSCKSSDLYFLLNIITVCEVLVKVNCFYL